MDDRKRRKQRIEEASILKYEELGCATKKSTIQSTMSFFVRSNTAKDELEVLPSKEKQELETTKSETSEFSRDPSFVEDEVRQLDELLDNISWTDGDSTDSNSTDGNSTDGEYDDDLNMEMEGLAYSEQLLAEELESVEVYKSLFMSEHFKVRADPMESMDVVEEISDYETRDARLETSGRDPRGKREPVAESHDDRFPLGVYGRQNHLCSTGLENFLDEATCCPLSASQSHSGFHQSTPQKHRSDGSEKTKILDDASGVKKEDGQDAIACDIEICSSLNTYPKRAIAILRQLQTGRPGNLGKEKDAQTHNTHDTQRHQTSSPPPEIGFPSKIPHTSHQPSEEGVGHTPVLSSAELSNHQESLSEGLGMFTGTIDFSSPAVSSRSPEKTAIGSSHVDMGHLYDSSRARVQRTADSESSDSSKSESIDSSESEGIEGAEGAEGAKVEVSATPIIEELTIHMDDNITEGTASSTLSSNLVLSTGSQKRESSTTKVQTARKKKADQNASKRTVKSNQAYRSSTKSSSKFPGGTGGERADASSHSCGKATVVTAQIAHLIVDTKGVGDVEEQGQETIWAGCTIEAEAIALEEDGTKSPKGFKISAILIGCLLLIVIGGIVAKFFFIPSPTKETPRPLNDVCASAIGLLSTNTSQVDGSTVGATFDDVGSCGSASRSGNGVWYTIYGNGKPIKASTCQGTYFDTSIAVYSGTCGQLSCISGNNDGLPSNQCGTQSSVTWPTSDQQTYYILVKGSTDDSNGKFTLSITETVENDVCRSAIGPVPADGRRIGGSTVSATYDEAPQCGSPMTHGIGVWYVTLGTGFPMVASTCGGASFETQISVFKGACGRLLCVVGNDDSCGLQSSVSWATAIGEMYYILVKGPANDAGEFSLTVKETVRNDSCQAAIGPLPTDKFSTSGSTQDTTVDNSGNSPPCGKVSESGSGVWYAVEGNGYFISANTCNGKDIVSPVQLILYGGACDDLTCIYAYDDVCGLQSSVSWNAAPGVKYYILVQGLNGNDASFELTIEESRRGDFCDTAIIPVKTNSPSPLDIEGTTEGGVYFDSNQGFCGSEPASQVAWYSIVGNGKIMAASTCTSYTDFTAVLTVYTGTCGALKCASTVVQDKCTSRHGDQYVSWGTVEGQEYFIVVYSDAAFEEGSFNLRLELDLERPADDNGDDYEESGGLAPLVYIMAGGCSVMLVLVVWRWRKFKASQRRYY
jgi:hypothetical protein